MKNFQGFSYDASTGYAKVGTGNTLGSMYMKLEALGRAIPAGLCPYVGTGVY